MELVQEVLVTVLLRDHGIKINMTHIIRENNTVVTILVQPKAVNDNTTLQCVAFSQDLVGLRSEEVLLQIQGKCVVFMSMELAIINSIC